MRKLAAIALALAFFVSIVSSQDRAGSTWVTYFSENAAQAAQTKVYATSDLAKQASAALAQTSGRIELAGLSKPVEVLRDKWDVAHIYAQTQEDLFFAQGFVAAQDRLWQMEIWRRTGEGKLAEILGPSAIERDKFARLMRGRQVLPAAVHSREDRKEHRRSIGARAQTRQSGYDKTVTASITLWYMKLRRKTLLTLTTI